MPLPGFAPCFFIKGKSRGSKLALGPWIQQQRHPPETSSQFSESSRFRLRLPSNLPRNRALAWDFLAIHSGAALSPIGNCAVAWDLPAIYLGIALSPETSSRFTREWRSPRDVPAIHLGIAFSTPGNRVRAQELLSIYSGISLSPHDFAQHIHETRIHVPPARPRP